MKNLGRIVDNKDITTKEYVDSKSEQLDNIKLEPEDLVEFTNAEVLDIWNQIMGESNP